jgi:SCP-2 sterol transfer family
MSHKTAYLWGPLSSFSAPLAAWLLNKGWHLHIATKSSLNLLTLSSLELASSARDLLVQALGGLEQFRIFQDRVLLLEHTELARDVQYDAVIFCGLPPNFDDARVPRAPWAAEELPKIARILKGVPIFVVSSLWGAIQKDRVVPEELEFERRKATTHWERICQSYEQKLIAALSTIDSNWYFVRMPMLSGATTDGATFSLTGPSTLFRELDLQYKKNHNGGNNFKTSGSSSGQTELVYNPDSTLWFLPVDVAVYMFWRFLEDEVRPRICNFVSTQATLNREWLQHLARALGMGEIIQSERDSFNLPSVLRKLLSEDVQVKTRNLFEVSGRYQLPPVRLDNEYFDRIVSFGREKRWGLATTPQLPVLPFSRRLASYYFEHFIPEQFTDKLLRRATKGGITIGFLLTDAGGLGWVLKASNGEPTVERIEQDSEKPRICFKFTGQTMAKLIESRLPLSRALLLREVEIDGPLFDALRVYQALERFLKEHPLNAHEISVFTEM